jgi:formiminoglutamase
MTNVSLQYLSKSDLLIARSGEVRLGEKMIFRNDSDLWKAATYHVLGVCEDFGPRLNGGFSGAKYAFDAFIQRFVNTQSNAFLDGNDIAVHGAVVCKEPKRLVPSRIDELDEFMTDWVKSVKDVGGIPVVIGGGHNNAYGLIKGVSEYVGKAIAVVNCDPHADTRAMDVRHSGNPFSYAIARNYLAQYTVLGLHESYNNAYILDFLKKNDVQHSFYENWIDEPERFFSDIDSAAKRHQHIGCGLELDMDSIAGMPSSAFTPSGITMEQARYYIRRIAQRVPIHYVHLPEAAPHSELDQKIVGKGLVYLVLDFIKCQSNLRKELSS